MILQSAYIDRESNGRHGIVRDMIGPQNEINKRRSKFLAPVIGAADLRHERHCRKPGSGQA
jgi:hypothetical protein